MAGAHGREPTEGPTGTSATPTVDGTTLTIDGDWSDADLTLGFKYEMNVQLPVIYFSQKQDESYRSDVHASLVIHRMKLDFGPVGVYKTTLRRTGRDDFTQLYDANMLGQYKLGELQIANTKQQTVPIYDRNVNATIELVSDHPSPATLYGMSWEGDYSTRFYQRA